MQGKEVVRQIWIAPMDEREVTLTVFDLVSEFVNESQRKSLIEESMGALHDMEEMNRIARARLETLLAKPDADEIDHLDRRNRVIMHFMDSARKALSMDGYEIVVTDGREWLCLWRTKPTDTKTFLWGKS